MGWVAGKAWQLEAAGSHSGSRRFFDGLHDALAGRLGRRRLHDDRSDGNGSRDRRGGPGRRGKADRGRGRRQIQAFEYLRAESRRQDQSDRGRRSELAGKTSLPCTTQNEDDVTIETGLWDPEAPKPLPGEEDTRFARTDVMPSAIRIVAAHRNAPLFFARAFGHDSFSVSSEAIARYQPRDIAAGVGLLGLDERRQRVEADRRPTARIARPSRATCWKSTRIWARPRTETCSSSRNT